ncbi:MAG: D-sedoheptulose 7-phosphate isomerase [Candidatus Makana argininalis]
MYKNLIVNELNESLFILNKFIKNNNNIKLIEKAAKIIANTFKSGCKIISCGNGGSHCDSMHLSEELMGFYREYRCGYPSISICDSSYISCVSNDLNYSKIFSRYIDTIGKKGDLLIALTTSGNSKNIINAVNVAKKKKIKVIIFTGNYGYKIKKDIDLEICINHIGYADRIQEMHIKIIHIIILIVEKIMKKKNKN